MAEETVVEPTTLIYVHDPMCSWCWGFSPALKKLMDGLPEDIQVTRVLGGLAPDSDVPMTEEMRQYLQKTWQRIQSVIPGTHFNFEYWTDCVPRRSTYPACRAVIAARQQGEQYDETMTEAIQQAYYLEARNPSDRDTLVDIAGTIGLDRNLFAEALDSEEVQQALMVEINASRELGIQGFPSLLLVAQKRARRIAIDHNNPDAMLREIRARAEV